MASVISLTTLNKKYSTRNARNLAKEENRISLRSLSTLLFCTCILLSSFFGKDALADLPLASFQKDTNKAMQQRDYDKAFAAVKQGLNRFPHDTWLLCHASLLAMYLDKEDEAISYRERALKEPNIKLENYFHIIRVSRELEDFQRALDITQIAMNKFPDSEALWVCHAESLRRVGKFKESRSLFERYLTKKPGNLGVWLNVMDNSRDLSDWQAIVKAGDKMETAVAFNKPARQSIIYARCLAAKGNAHMHLKEFKQARICFEKALLNMPMDRPILNSHMNACRELHDLQAVRRDQAKLADFDKGI
jgi:tetratricopeptide (TPR) repeat protein